MSEKPVREGKSDGSKQAAPMPLSEVLMYVVLFIGVAIGIYYGMSTSKPRPRGMQGYELRETRNGIVDASPRNDIRQCSWFTALEAWLFSSANTEQEQPSPAVKSERELK